MWISGKSFCAWVSLPWYNRAQSCSFRGLDRASVLAVPVDVRYSQISSAALTGLGVTRLDK